MASLGDARRRRFGLKIVLDLAVELPHGARELGAHGMWKFKWLGREAVGGVCSAADIAFNDAAKTARRGVEAAAQAARCEFEAAAERGWQGEWNAARDAAVAAIGTLSPYRIIQDTDDGLWRVQQQFVRTNPPYCRWREDQHRQWGLDTGRLAKPDMNVHAYIDNVTFPLPHHDRTAAEKWLRDYASPPVPKVFDYDASGQPVVAA